MKVLLDECLPKRLKHEIEADLVLTVPEAGWASKKNGELLKLAESEFEVGGEAKSNSLDFAALP